MGSSGCEGRRWKGGETTDKASVNFINGLVRCSAAQLIQPVNPCLSHYIGATSLPLCQDRQPRDVDRTLVKGQGREKNMNRSNELKQTKIQM